MHHYTYRITSKILNKHYYGCRSSKINPNEDLGFKYFSSSTNTEFILDQKQNPQNYKYKVIKVFNTREEAIKHEILLHNKFNVDVNKNFYNKAKQTSEKFSFNNSGLISVKNILTETYCYISNDEFDSSIHIKEGSTKNSKRTPQFKDTLSKRMKGVPKNKDSILTRTKTVTTPDENGITIAYKGYLSAQQTKQQKFELDNLYFEKINKKISENKKTLCENGKTKAVNSAAKSMETKRKIDENGKNIIEKSAEKLKITMKTVEQNGKTKAENTAAKSAETMKTTKNEKGLSIYEQSGIKQSETKMKKSKRYDVYSIILGKRLYENLTPKELYLISPSLISKTKDSWLGIDAPSLQSRLINLNQEYKIGLYIINVS